MECVVGLDLSYTRSGVVCVGLDGTVIDITSFGVPDGIKRHNVYDIANALPAALWVAGRCREYWETFGSDLKAIIVEVPVLATGSGAWLGLMQQALYPMYPEGVSVVLVGATAINGVVYPPRGKAKRGEIRMPVIKLSSTAKKNGIVAWVYDHYDIVGDKLNHDEASAVVLCDIYRQIHCGEYKKKFTLLDKSRRDGKE